MKNPPPVPSTKEPPKLSIITPVFNSEKFISGCIENVMSALPLPIEHIIIDGQSQDATASIIKAYAEKNPHIHWISEKDQGQSDAMNKGIALAQAEIIGFLNADDFYEDGALKSIIQHINSIDKKVQTPLWIANCHIVGNGDQRIGVNIPTARNIYQLIAGYDSPYNASAYFYHKNIHKIIGGYALEDHYTMDLEFLLRAYAITQPQYVPETWGNFRFIEGTKTFEDQQRKASQGRCDALRHAAYQKLSWLEKSITKCYRVKKYTDRTIEKIKNKLLK
jgi:glycosyltransferase involved in cell wall biosynthesis